MFNLANLSSDESF